MKSLQATINHIKEDPFLGDKQIRVGKIHYLAARDEPKRPAKFAVHFTVRITDGGVASPLKTDYIFDGQWLVEKKHTDKLILKKQIVGPNESYDPLSLDGAFPLPVGQKRRDILKRFNVTLITPLPQDTEVFGVPTVHLHLIPRSNVDATTTSQEFQSIDLWYNAATLHPIQVKTINRNDVETTVRLKNTDIDTITEDDAAQLFNTDLAPAPKGWDVEIEPL
ncbi:MAG: LolA family protein [Planctomycetota bacterium]